MTLLPPQGGGFNNRGGFRGGRGGPRFPMGPPMFNPQDVFMWLDLQNPMLLQQVSAAAEALNIKLQQLEEILSQFFTEMSCAGPFSCQLAP